MALGGDCVITRRVSHLRAPGFVAAARLLRSADVAFGNCEIALPTDATRVREAGPFALVAPPEMADELARFGIGLMSLANNHAVDAGVRGALETKGNLESAGIVVAGAGRGGRSARSRAIRDTGAGRVALVACLVSRSRPPAEGISHITLGSTAGVSDRDFAPILAETTRAASEADVVIVSIHCHEQARASARPPAFLRRLARQCLRAGGSIVTIHGPHRIGGVELRGRGAVLYGLGSLLFQPESVPADRAFGSKRAEAAIAQSALMRSMRAWLARPTLWEGAIAIAEFWQQRLTGLTLHPLSLHATVGGGARGTPILAAGRAARPILEQVRARCAELGTSVRCAGGIAHVQIPRARRSPLTASACR